METSMLSVGCKNIVLVGLLVATLAGCGGGGGSSHSSNAPLVFEDQQAASVVIGQDDFAHSGSGLTATYLSSLYGNPVVYNGILYLPDCGNDRILGFNSIPTTNGAAADFVLGQTDFTSSSAGSGASQLNEPQTVDVHDGKMFVVDYGNDRVLIYDPVPISGPGTATVVVGQSAFGDTSGLGSDALLNNPETIRVVAGKLIVTDSRNNRVLIWNSIPTTNGVAADIVLGQSDFTHTASNDDDQNGTSEGPTARTMDGPAGVWSDGTRLVVLDYANNRALIWTSFPTQNFAPADLAWAGEFYQ